MRSPEASGARSVPLTAPLAEIICSIRSEDLPPAVVTRTVDAILDGVATAAAGCQEPAVAKMVAHLQKLGGAPVASFWGHAYKGSAPQAACVNAMATHVLDFEPMWSPPMHPVSTTVPVALALAQARSLSGMDVVAAVAIGMELQGRLQLAADQYDPEALRFHPPGVAGTLGASVVASRLMGLSAEGTRHALGIAASRAGSLLANVGTMTKCAHCGFAAAAGLESAMLAETGFTANQSIFEAPKGIAEIFFPEGIRHEAFLAFGRPWRIVDPGLAIKLFPSQYATHFAIDAALKLRSHMADPFRLEKIRIVSPLMRYIDRPSPGAGLEGKFSLQYCVAIALLDARVTIDSFSQERFLQPDLTAMLGRIELHQTDSIPGDWRKMRVEIHALTVDGQELDAISLGPPGCWGQGPVSSGMHREKLLDCLTRSMPVSMAEQLIDRLSAIDRSTPQEIQEILSILG
jgi:aconitate decarboxylase